MNRSALHLVVTLGVAAIASASHAGIVNPSFEELDENYEIKGWSVPEGFSLPRSDTNLWGGLPNPGSGNLCATMVFGEGGSQLITLNEGEIVLFDWALTPSGTYPIDNYFLQVWLIDPALSWPVDGNPWDPSTPTRWNMNQPFGSPLVEQWFTDSVRAPATGTYRLGFSGHAGANYGNDGMWVMIDNFRVVPSPGAAALLVLGGAVAARRRR